MTPERERPSDLTRSKAPPPPAAAPERRKERGASAGGSVPRAADDDGTGFDVAGFEAAGSAGGGVPSNTPPQKTTHGGEDWLSVSFYVDFLKFETLAHELDEAKQAAASEIPGDEIQLGDVRCLVQPSGASRGSGPKSQKMRWRLTTEQGLTVLVMNRAEAHKTQPNVSIEAKSLLLMRQGLSRVWPLMQHVVEQLGVQIVKHKLSRVDACIDLAEVMTSVYCDAFTAGWCVTRARKKRRHGEILPYNTHEDGRLPTGFNIGRREAMLRVYDKLHESRRDPLKLAVLETQRWGKLPRAATRVEFEFRRDSLKDFGVETVEDWVEKRAEILHQRTHSWFRLTEGPVDRSHADRAKTHPFWELVQRRFAECYGPGTGVELVPLPKLWVDTSQREQMAVGIFKGIFARVGKPIQDNEHFLREAVFAIRSAMMDRDMADEVRRKALELGVEGL